MTQALFGLVMNSNIRLNPHMFGFVKNSNICPYAHHANDAIMRHVRPCKNLNI
jgi:hypothetical protein